MLMILGIGATYVWVGVFGAASQQSSPTACAPPDGFRSDAALEPQAPLGQPLGQDALDRTTPAVPRDAMVQVLNANGQRGQAGLVTEALRQLGFTQVAEAKNDHVYANLDMRCRAQIRFGHQGMAAARTLSLLEPCAELVRDERQDATVDLAVGLRFDDVRPNPAARQILRQLTGWAAAHPEQRGGLQSDPTAQPVVDPALLAAARTVSC